PQATVWTLAGENRNNSPTRRGRKSPSLLANFAETATLAAIAIVVEIGLARISLRRIPHFHANPSSPFHHGSHRCRRHLRSSVGERFISSGAGGYPVQQPRR